MDEETDVASGVELQTEKRKKKTDRIDPSEKESRVQRFVRAGFHNEWGDEDLGLESTQMEI